ncbi:MAG: branched-chain amino acid aminotransferase [Alphaproteobacteria bacterium]|nr:branched-chain amino acid aminotransferase [Alphaproteobacteria bacterium]
MAILPFDDRDGVIWFNGKMVPWRDAKTHVLCHGLHYASSVFEGIRAYGGKAFKLREHMERFKASAQMLDFEIPYSVDELCKATEAVLKEQHIVDGYIRPVAWRGSEMMAISAQNNKTHTVIATWDWPAMFGKHDIRKEGVRLAISKWKRPSPETEPTASKAAGLYMICTLSKHAAERAGFQDAMMLDWRGYVAEATGANIFFVMKNGEIHTPKPDCFLDGITRRTVIELAKARGYTVVERHITPEEMADAKEAFLTGTAAEVTPVAAVENYTFTIGPVALGLMDDYAALVRGTSPETLKKAAG